MTHPRKRRFIKCFLAALSALLLGTCWVSVEYGYGYQWVRANGKTFQVILCRGGLALNSLPRAPCHTTGLDRWPSGVAIPPWPTLDTDSSRSIVAFHLPLWMPCVASMILTVILWRRFRPFPSTHCQSCGYNLRGNESGICAECGTSIAWPATAERL